MKPISFNTDMVKAILDGRKTQTRRPIKPQPIGEFVRHQNTLGYPASEGFQWFGFGNPDDPIFYKPKYQVGDILWVRERARYFLNDGPEEHVFIYEADDELSEGCAWPERIKPIAYGHCVPNGCFRELARIFLKVTGVRVERVQDISDKEIEAEGVEVPSCPSCGYTTYDCGIQLDHNLCPQPDPLSPRPEFMCLWNSVYPGSWERNDWVFVYEFERTEI